MAPTKTTILDGKRGCLNFNRLVRVVVGENEVPFMLHSEILEAASGYFKGACKDEWLDSKDGEIGTIRLINDDPEHFRIFANYIYSGNLDVNLPQAAKVTTPGLKVPKASTQSKLIELFIFGDNKLASSFKNAVIDKLLECIETDGLYCSNNINLVFEETAPSSPLRRLMVDCAIYFETSDELATGTKNRTVEFTTELVREFAILISRPRLAMLSGSEVVKLPPWANGRCAYHFHESAPLNYRCDSSERTAALLRRHCQGRNESRRSGPQKVSLEFRAVRTEL